MNQWQDDYEQYRANADEQEQRAYKAERDYRFRDAATYWQAAAVSYEFAARVAAQGLSHAALTDAVKFAAAFHRNAARAEERERDERYREEYADRMKQANRYEAKGRRAAHDGDYEASARMFEAAADQWNEARAAAQAGRDEIATDDAAEKANLMLDYAHEAADAKLHAEREENR